MPYELFMRLFFNHNLLNNRLMQQVKFLVNLYKHGHDKNTYFTFSVKNFRDILCLTIPTQNITSD